MTRRIPKAIRAVLSATFIATLVLIALTAINWLVFGEFWIP